MQGAFYCKTVLIDIYNNTKQNSQPPSFSRVFFHQAWVSLASPPFSSYTSVLAFRDFSCNILIRECVGEEKNTDSAKKYIAHGDLLNERLQCLENPASLYHSFKVLRKEFSSISTDFCFMCSSFWRRNTLS